GGDEKVVPQPGESGLFSLPPVPLPVPPVAFSPPEPASVPPVASGASAPPELLELPDPSAPPVLVSPPLAGRPPDPAPPAPVVLPPVDAPPVPEMSVPAPPVWVVPLPPVEVESSPVSPEHPPRLQAPGITSAKPVSRGRRSKPLSVKNAVLSGPMVGLTLPPSA